MGAFASRATVMTGSAVYLAATDLRRKLLAAAGRLLQAAPDDLAIEDGRIHRDTAPSLGLADLAGELALQAKGERAVAGQAEAGPTRGRRTEADQADPKAGSSLPSGPS